MGDCGALPKMVSKISALPNKWAVRVGSQYRGS